MSATRRALASSITTKLLVGVTGLSLFIYLITHLGGNLLILFGRDVFNRYAYTLESNPLIPVIEIGLLLVFFVHVFKAVAMYLANRRARPHPYVQKTRAGAPSRKSFASSTMILSGLWLLAFVVIHVRSFRYGTEYAWPAGGRDLYRLEMEIFSSPLVVGFYVLSMLVVGSHLWHGASSALQSLGLDHPTWTPRILLGGKVAAVIIAGAFIVIAVWAHVAGSRL
jgi:succinate dehydrogenase / fumarate reductase cytochrome b subunit